MSNTQNLISIVIPCYNEKGNISAIYKSLEQVRKKLLQRYQLEYIFVDDGSEQSSVLEYDTLPKEKNIKVVVLARNFGKEIALSAGLSHTSGQAAIMIDADGQHPPEKIVDLIQYWSQGYDVVRGVRTENTGEGLVKKIGSKAFYRLFNSLSGTTLTPGGTDFCLIDRQVIDEFVKMDERNRISRGLIDWMGYTRTNVYFQANERQVGDAAYSTKKLFKLAMNSFVSLSFKPLFIAGYIGIFCIVTSVLLGLFVLIEQYLLNDPLGINVGASGIFLIALLFMAGVILSVQGVTAIYLSHIYTQVQNRPLFLVNKKLSKRL